ncbi:hypothetical protein MHYP_G00004390 [Metynnis hypsauchen]
MLRWSSWEMAALALLEDIANGRTRRERVFRDHYDFLAHDDDWLISRFRFPRAVLLELCAELGPVLERDTARNRASPVPLQVLTALGFLATGSFQRELADRSGISQSSLSCAMPAVLDGIICMSASYLGDSGYALLTWLMTPLWNPQTDRERRYNSLHSRTRSVVERAIGQLKSRWRCLDRTGGMLLYRPEKVCRIVRACGVLHNVAQDSRRQDTAGWKDISCWQVGRAGGLRDARCTRDVGGASQVCGSRLRLRVLSGFSPPQYRQLSGQME